MKEQTLELKTYGSKPLMNRFLALGSIVKKKGYIAVDKLVVFEK